jgi:hypothetical protein
MATQKTENATLTALEIDAITGEQTTRPLNADELLAINENVKVAAKTKLQADAKAAARESALSKLAALGLTQEEIDAL